MGTMIWTILFAAFPEESGGAGAPEEPDGRNPAGEEEEWEPVPEPARNPDEADGWKGPVLSGPGLKPRKKDAAGQKKKAEKPAREPARRPAAADGWNGPVLAGPGLKPREKDAAGQKKKAEKPAREPARKPAEDGRSGPVPAGPGLKPRVPAGKEPSGEKPADAGIAEGKKAAAQLRKEEKLERRKAEAAALWE